MFDKLTSITINVLMAVLLIGFLALPITSLGLASIGNIDGDNQEVLSAQDETFPSVKGATQPCINLEYERRFFSTEPELDPVEELEEDSEENSELEFELQIEDGLESE